jgi:hypothetical protein
VVPQAHRILFPCVVSALSGLSSLLAQVKSSAVSEEVLQAKLRAHVDAKDAELAQLGEGEDGDDGGGAGSKGASASAAAAAATPFFIGGMDMENIELNYLFGEDFKIAYWY